jgi:hypothetical protein
VLRLGGVLLVLRVMRINLLSLALWAFRQPSSESVTYLCESVGFLGSVDSLWCLRPFPYAVLQMVTRILLQICSCYEAVMVHGPSCFVQVGVFRFLRDVGAGRA